MGERYELQRGMKFRWIISSRLDLMWMAAHPPLSLLDETVIWIPQTRFRNKFEVTRHGVNDWHATVPRHLASAYFERWELLSRGRAPVIPNHDPEEFLKSVLRTQDVHIGRFQDVASLAMCRLWHCYWKFALQGRPKRQVLRWADEGAEIQEYAPGLRNGNLVWARQTFVQTKDNAWGGTDKARHLRLTVRPSPHMHAGHVGNVGTAVY